MTTPKPLWHYLSILPAIVTVAGIFFMLVLSFFISDNKLFIVLSFAMAELCMVMAGIGGVAYLLNPHKTSIDSKWIMINIGLFFSAACSGLILFLML
jgi:glucose uptake protein GlcU